MNFELPSEQMCPETGFFDCAATLAIHFFKEHEYLRKLQSHEPGFTIKPVPQTALKSFAVHWQKINFLWKNKYLLMPVAVPVYLQRQWLTKSSV